MVPLPKVLLAAAVMFLISVVFFKPVEGPGQRPRREPKHVREARDPRNPWEWYQEWRYRPWGKWQRLIHALVMAVVVEAALTVMFGGQIDPKTFVFGGLAFFLIYASILGVWQPSRRRSR